MNNTNGRIAQRSRMKMVNALFSLMEQYSFGEITVTQIAQESGLSRKTFYRLFSSKEKILIYQYDLWFKEILARIKDEKLHSYWDVVQCFFDFCEQHKDLLALLKRRQVLSMFFEYIEDNSITVFEYVHSKETAHNYSVPMPYLLAYSVGGMFSMLVKWVENDMDVESTEFLKIIKAGYMSPRL